MIDNAELPHLRYVSFRRLLSALLTCATLIAFVVAMGQQAWAGQLATARSDLIRKYVAQGLTLSVIKARLSKLPRVMLAEKAPSVSQVTILGKHDLRLDGAILTYFGMVSYVTQTHFKLSSELTEGGFVFVIDESVKTWADIMKFFERTPAYDFFRSTYDEAIRQGVELHTCEYVPVYRGTKIPGGLVFLNPKHGYWASDICLYRSVFAVLGFAAVANIDSGYRDVALDLRAIEALYKLDEDQLGVNRVIDAVAAKVIDEDHQK